MREFFIAQMDYIFFVYGLAFILLAMTAYFISRVRPADVFWKWIVLFGLLHGITEWLDMFALSLGKSVLFEMIRLVFLSASFLCFVELVRCEAYKRRGKIFGPWVYLPLLSVTLSAGWMLGGLTGINILSRYVFGVIGGLLAVRVIIFSLAQSDGEGENRVLFLFAWLLGCYVTTQFFAPKGTFLPASMINQEAFFSSLGFPVQLFRMILAAVLAGLVWNGYHRELMSKLPENETKSGLRKELYFSACLVVILLAGWLVTEVAGREKDLEKRNDQLDRVKVAAATINPGHIKALFGVPADVQSESYQRIQKQFLNILQAQTNLFYIYLFGQKDGENIFLVDVASPAKKFLLEPVAQPGEVYKEDAELLNRMFSFGGVAKIGPETDKWGTFVSSYVAIRDPASGKVIAVLGFDDGGQEWASMIDRHRLIYISITLLFVVLFVSFFIILIREQEIKRARQLKAFSEIKSKFAAMVSHELRSPLAVIKVSLEIILDGMSGSVNDEQRHILEVAKKNIDRLGRLVNNVLDFQKIESKKMGYDFQENDLNELLTEVQRSMSVVSKKEGLEIKVELAEGLSKMKFDGDRLTQVLTNLVSNAINNTKRGCINLTAQKENDEVHIRVQDVGSGIPAEDIPRLFQPFEQVYGNSAKKKGGAGLGLVIAKEIVLAHHGKIWVESDVGKGSTFHFTLPL